MLRALLLVLLLFYSVALAYKARLDYIESKLREEEHNKQMEVYITAKNKLKESIFKCQPGLYRRCTWWFEIDDYTNAGLGKIFVKQLEKNSWFLSPDVNIIDHLDINKDIVHDNGGFTDKLAYTCKLIHADFKFLESMTNPNILYNSVITQDIIDTAFIELRCTTDKRSENIGG